MWGVVNAGVPSYNIRQSIDRFHKDVLPRRQPRVVVLQAANDISLASFFQEDWNPDRTWVSHRFSLPSGRSRTLSRWLALSHYTTQLRRSPEPVANRTYEKWDCNGIVAETRSNLRALSAFCRQQDINLVILPVDPFYYQTSHQEKNERLKQFNSLMHPWIDCLGPMIAEFNAALENEARSQPGVWFFDTRRLLDELDREELFVDFIHYSDKGNAVIARELLDFMKRNRILK